MGGLSPTATSRPPQACSVSAPRLATISIVSDTDPGQIALASAMKARIDALGLSAVEIANRGGPQRGALREIIKGRRLPRKSTLADIDAVLGWPPGLAKDILDQKVNSPDPNEHPTSTTEHRIGVVRAHLLQLVKDHRRMSQTHSDTAELIVELIDLLDSERT